MSIDANGCDTIAFHLGIVALCYVVYEIFCWVKGRRWPRLVEQFFGYVRNTHTWKSLTNFNMVWRYDLINGIWASVSRFCIRVFAKPGDCLNSINTGLATTSNCALDGAVDHELLLKRTACMSLEQVPVTRAVTPIPADLTSQCQFEGERRTDNDRYQHHRTNSHRNLSGCSLIPSEDSKVSETVTVITGLSNSTRIRSAPFASRDQTTPWDSIHSRNVRHRSCSRNPINSAYISSGVDAEASYGVDDEDCSKITEHFDPVFRSSGWRRCNDADENQPECANPPGYEQSSTGTDTGPECVTELVPTEKPKRRRKFICGLISQEELLRSYCKPQKKSYATRLSEVLSKATTPHHESSEASGSCHGDAHIGGSDLTDSK